MAWVNEKVETVKSKMSSTRARMGNAAGRTKKKIGKALKRAYHVPKNRIMATKTGQAAKKKYRKAKSATIYAKEKFAEFKDEITLKETKMELKYVLKKKWWLPLMVFLLTYGLCSGSVDGCSLGLIFVPFKMIVCGFLYIFKLLSNLLGCRDCEMAAFGGPLLVVLYILLGTLNFLAWLLQCPRPELIPAIVEASKSEIPWLLIILALLVLPFLIYLLVKYCRGKPTILLKNDEGLWEYAPSQKKQIMKGDRRQFKMKGN